MSGWDESVTPREFRDAADRCERMQREVRERRGEPADMHALELAAAQLRFAATVAAQTRRHGKAAA